MTDFHTLLDEYVGAADSIADISATVRRLWFYDFEGYPLRLWQGKGKLYTQDGNEWLGTIDANNNDHHATPAIQDGRDGSSASYEMSLTIPSIPGQSDFELYNALKAEQGLVAKRKLTSYLAIFKVDEALRPETPIVFYKELTMFSPKFSEKTEFDGGMVKRIYKVSIIAKDDNYGRSSIPNGTYTDTVQKRRAEELGVTGDRGCEYVATLANRTVQIP